MTEHHRQSEGNGLLVLSGSIVIAAIMLSASFIIVGGDISSSLTDLTITTTGTGNSGSGTGNDAVVAPTPTPPAAGQTVQMSDIIDNAAGSIGDPDAPVVIVEWSDYQCPFCRRWYNDSKENIFENYVETGKVRFIFKDFPLNFHPMAEPYALAARCAGDQDQYWEMHDKIYDEQNPFGQGTVSNLTEEDIKQWASDLGLGTSSFNSCFDSAKYAADITANFNEGAANGINGTPGFIIGTKDGEGVVISGAQPYTVFQQTIDSLLG
jgi:protein-disulfide isomerase